MLIKSDSELIFPELSYKIIGAAFKVFNELGWGLPEKNYGLALEKELQDQNVACKKEIYIPIKYKTSNIGKYYADFIIEGKILLELKVVTKLGYTQARQLLGYLRSAGIKLGILIYFTKDGVKYRRVINSQA
ncbi:MAG: hypothetical protein A3B23_03580 [Candidatus Colwellbacteria bacterium RIFCSPLOWO2_01_FULL_48_10]|uniref:GxxExxY protein n=1 Tax=Candidatus Colwellbacteria bacterium RIFCSPLOWO2_01_FULL_48_10 TaxID=1797690 RepID=A0A1G1Z570_9BACT|nr:MAG: hypothetical protein A3B23_03580 [Candidatus Colwellbacteria bacterium RIFCSPLOWO2_01_FULL_48_10]